ncbi:MAG: hypothetical protein HY906_01495 [Deltaproteobacteria bacterium]|nr:hypothetical protein [Deltaproteobacteria bacterium]
MKANLPRMLVALALVALWGCGGGGGGGQADAATDAGGQTDTGAGQSDGQRDSGALPDGQGGAPGLGEDCTCTGSGCQQMGVPKPAGGTIVGCEEVPTGVTGGALVCLRSYGGDLATKTYFANGYCALMATTCTGASLICDSAVFGDYATMTACPVGSVMISDSQAVDVLGQQATVQNKVCVRLCAGNADCRTTETDPALGDAATQYQCIDKGGVKFCYDPRNLSASYTATAF